MPIVIPNGGNDDITSSELTAYDSGIRQIYNTGTQTVEVPISGSMTVQETELVQAVEEKLDAIVEGWIDSGGPGGLQRAASREILRRAALLQGDMAASVRQWSKQV